MERADSDRFARYDQFDTTVPLPAFRGIVARNRAGLAKPDGAHEIPGYALSREVIAHRGGSILAL